jgi:hypothetical protein
MSDRYESHLDRQIREAAERGEFDDLPGTGKPLPDSGRPLDDEWWLRGLAARESLSAALPPALALRREVEDLPDRLVRFRYEGGVREHLADLNERILRARRGPVDGPPVTVNVVDVEALVTRWRERAEPR